ncbi:MAG: hypothetical protein NUV42_02105 [Candidatus Yonathbacteria bacterium]|nr:hypothetical protein [Candidatus Yonathbacteria bacterium]
MKKLLDKNNPENTVVRVVLRGPDKKEYECVGVLVREKKNMVRVSFNAIDDVVKDYLDIEKKDILSIDTVETSEISKM